MRQGAADPAADAAQEEQVWGPGECPGRLGASGLARGSRGSGPGLAGQWLHGEMYQCGASFPPPQGNQLRKMLLQNYLQNRKSSSRGDLPDPVGTGQYCLPRRVSGRPIGPGPGSSLPLPRPIAPPQENPPPPGLDQDWSAIAATQCRLDKEGATKLVCDLITSTKNEKIFQESIGLAIRLLDGGNTEIQVWGAGARLLWAGASSSGGGRWQVSEAMGLGCCAGCWRPFRVWLPVGGSTSHICPFSIHALSLC